jgi:hypothetical protein
MGGEFNTCLNTPIFMKVWDKIIADKRTQFHDWTVKVDPDAVFFPERLRALLPNHKETPKGVYLNNCRFGMHGPLEVFSRNAVNAWADGRWACVNHFRQLCSGNCHWGEDMFIDQCMMKVLKLKREFEPKLLVEDHCKPPPGWADCNDAHMVSFHPFKKLEAYGKCLDNAEAEARPFQASHAAPVEFEQYMRETKGLDSEDERMIMQEYQEDLQEYQEYMQEDQRLR